MTFAAAISAQQRLLLDPGLGHAAAVTRYPEGDLNAGETLYGLFEPDDAPLVERDERGHRLTHNAVLDVDESQAVNDRDRFEIAGQLWEVEGVGDALFGLKPVRMKRVERIALKQTRVTR